MNARLVLRAALVIALAFSTQIACKTHAGIAGRDDVRPQSAAADTMADRVVITNVTSESQLLAILESLGYVEGVREVRRIDFDRKTNEVLLEIIGERRRQTHWRAFLENLPKTTKVAPDTARKELPAWFTKPSTN